MSLLHDQFWRLLLAYIMFFPFWKVIPIVEDSSCWVLFDVCCWPASFFFPFWIIIAIVEDSSCWVVFKLLWICKKFCDKWTVRYHALSPNNWAWLSRNFIMHRQLTCCRYMLEFIDNHYCTGHQSTTTTIDNRPHRQPVLIDRWFITLIKRLEPIFQWTLNTVFKWAGEGPGIRYMVCACSLECHLKDSFKWIRRGPGGGIPLTLPFKQPFGQT